MTGRENASNREMRELDKKNRWIAEPRLWLIFLGYLLVAAFSFNRGLLLTDEGYQLYFSWRIASGEKIYRDFSLQVAPLSFFIQALLIKWFGPELIVSRLWALLIGTGGFFGIAYLSRKIVSGKSWLIGPGLYILFSNNLFNFAHYSVESKYYLLFSLALALAWLGSGSAISFFLSGMFAGMAACSYQSFAIIAFLELAAFLAGRDRKKIPGWKKPAAVFLLGAALSALPIAIYLGRERLLQETVSALIFSAGTKKHIYYFLLCRVLPVSFAAVLATLALKKLWNLGGIAQVSAIVILILVPVFLATFSFEHPVFIAHGLSLLVPLVLYALSFAYLRESPRLANLWPALGFCCLVLLVGLLSGYDLGHNLVSAIFLLPWIGFLFERWQEKGRKILGWNIPGLLVLALFLGCSLYLFLSRFETYREVEPIYRCRSRLELKTAQWIYTSPAQKAELEGLVGIIQKLTRPGDKILVFPNHLLLYYLSQRPSVSRAPYFYYELADLGSLSRAVDSTLSEKSPVIFQMRGGKIFQPLASERANLLTGKISLACRDKQLLGNYLICSY